MVPFLIISVFIGSFMNSLIGVWLVIEVNMVLFLIILFNEGYSKGNIMKYFITQRVSSRLFFFSFFLTYIRDGGVGIFLNRILLISLSFKLGLAPFHGWYLRVVESLGWFSIFILSTLQKLLPLFAIRISVSSFRLYLIIVFSRLVGTLLIFEILVKRLIGYSRVFNIGWLLIVISNPRVFLLTFITYRITFFTVRMFFFKKSIEKVYKINLSTQVESLIFLVLVIRLAGVPPFLGFWFKVLAIRLMIGYLKFILILIFFIGSVFTLKAYLSLSLKVFFSVSYFERIPLKNYLRFSVIRIFIRLAPLGFLL